jgi:flagellar protein FliO/FliZ
MMDFLFGADMPLAVRFFFAFVIVLALIGGTAFLVRRFGGERLGASSSRGRQPRLAVIDAAAVDGRRRLILIRRDNVEHLLMIGGPSDVVVEANIVRAAAGARDAAGQRPPAALPDAMPRSAPLNEGNMWPLQPEPAPAPAPRPPRQQPAMEEPQQWHSEPEPPPPRRAEARPEPRAEMRPEPRSEVRPEPRSDMRPEPRLDVRPEPRTVDPLAGLAAELSRVQPEAPAPKPRPQPQRERDIPRARAPQPERMRPPPPPPSMDETTSANADQNLAEMAQRLEAALRRPKAPEPRAQEAAPKQAMMPPPVSEPMMPEPVSISAGDAAAHHDDEPPAAAQQQPAPARAVAAKPAPQKSVYDSLEQEMASLLGRPNSKT